MSETIPGTIVIANSADVVDSEIDVLKAQADELAVKTDRRFLYGDGQAVTLRQGKTAVVLVAVLDEAVTPEQFIETATALQRQFPALKAVGTIRQDAVPVLSDDYEVAYSGSLKMVAYPKQEQ